MLASGRFVNSTSSSTKSQHDLTAAPPVKQVSRQKRYNDLDEASSHRPGSKFKNNNKLQLNNESESINTSSASSSGYTSNNGGLNHLQYRASQANGLAQRGGSVQQLASSYSGHNLQPQQFHAHQQQQQQLMMNEGNENKVSPLPTMVNKIGSSLRRISANAHPQHHHHKHLQNHHHRHHNHLQYYHPERSCSQAQQLAQTSMMVPMMIDDDVDDEDDVDVGFDGTDLIDDDIGGAREGDDSNDLIAAQNGHDNNNNNNNNNKFASNESNTISAFDPQTLYSFRETHDDRQRRPPVDCVDSSAPALNNQVRSAANGEFQHNRYLQMLKQLQQQQQNGDPNNNRAARQAHHHHPQVMANTRRHLQQQQQQQQSIQTDAAAQSRLLVHNSVANYEIASGQQPHSLVYHHPNPADQFQQQYHSFSYHQPVQQLQLASSNNQHLQYYQQQQHLPGAAQVDSALENPSSSSNNSSGESVADNFIIIKQISKENKKQVKAAAASKNKQNKKNKDIMKAQQGSSRQHLSSPVDHQSSHHHHHRNKTTAGGTSSRKDLPVSRSSNQLVMANDEAKHLGCCGKMAKLLLFITNILFWSAGVALVAWGIYSLADDHKYNLSQLLIFEPSNKMSLFQLLSWSFITLGCASVLVGFCGCSAILKNNRWILGLYIFLILAIFALDLATGLLAIIFQEKLVANVRLRLINKLRSEYGVQASFTAAIDYIQTKFECCGLEGHFDYDQSLWRLQRLGGFEATVARTCCHLRNSFDDQAHVNPRPMNESMCQSTDVRFHQSYRYRKGCLDDLERMVRQKIWTFTIGCGAVGGVILLSLLFATCFCRLIPSHGSRKSSSTSIQQQQHTSSNHHHHHDKTPKQTGGLTLAQQMDAQQQRHYR